ncbi:putative membrane spanning protein [Granulibacter bethesdensis]|nr:putative membrane spanning protein [Granulibacter bethesdensis]
MRGETCTMWTVLKRISVNSIFGHAWTVSGLVCGMAVISAPVKGWTDQLLYDSHGTRIQAFMELGGVIMNGANINFGAGSIVYHDGRPVANRGPVTAELYFKPGVMASHHFNIGTLYGAVNAIGTKTVGHGDFEQFSQTGHEPFYMGLEEAYLGFETNLASGGGKDVVAIQGGRQVFKIDDGFLVGRGTYNTGGRAAWWYAPRMAFSGPGVIKFDGHPVRADIFALEVNSDAGLTYGFDRPRSSFAGFDVTLFRSKPGLDGAPTYANREAYVTLTYFNIYDSDKSSTYNYTSRANRDGMNVYSLSFGGSFVPIKALGIRKNFTLYGQYVGEQNSNASQGYQRVDAYAYYIEPGYSFSDLPWSPSVYYRRTTYSGENNPKGTVKRSYDPLFLYNGSRKLYGGYFSGEVVGEYLMGYSGYDVNQVGITLNPPFHVFKHDDKTAFNIIYYNVLMNHPSQYGLNTGSNKYSDEVDVSVNYQYSPTISGAMLAGVAFPGRNGLANVASYQPATGNQPVVGGNAYVLEAFIYTRF